MRSLIAFLLLASTALAGGPSIVGPKSVKVGQPPWVSVSVKDAGAGAVQTWSGAIGPGLVGMETKDGVAVSTAVPGRYAFRCIVQTPSEGIDPVVVLETVLVVEGDGVVPVPDVVPVVDWAARLTAAVKSKPEAHAGLAKVAGVYGLVADQIKSGLLTSPEQVTKMTTLLSNTASPDWAALEASIVQPHLKTLTLATAGDYEPVWRQVQAAIKAGLTDIPPPHPVDPPIPTSEFRVLILEETANRSKLPTSQLSVLTSAPLRKWMTENGANFRVWDKDVDASREDAAWQAALKLPHGELPWIHVSNGKTGFSGPLPKTAEETQTLIGKYKP